MSEFPRIAAISRSPYKSAGHKGKVHGLAFIGSGTLLFSASKDKVGAQLELDPLPLSSAFGNGLPAAPPPWRLTFILWLFISHFRRWCLSGT